MNIVRPRDFTPGRSWAALLVAEIDGVSVRLHWTEEPYVWHVNDGHEVFVVVDGVFDMHVCAGGVEEVHRLEPGDIFHADEGTAHVAHPIGPSRVLVIEREGSK